MKAKSDQNKPCPAGITRRDFMEYCAWGCAGAASLTFTKGSPLLAFGSESEKIKTKILVVYAHPDPNQPNWPNIGYDFAGHINQVHKRLTGGFPEINFLPVTVSSGSEETAREILSKDDGTIDGYLIYLAGCLWGRMTEEIAAAGKPTVFVDNLFAGSGEFLTSYAHAKRQGHKVMAVSSSDFEDMAEAVKCIDSLAKLKHSTILVVGSKPDSGIEKVYGCKVLDIPFEKINESYKRVKKEAVMAQADTWIRNAEKVIEPSPTEIEKAAGMYLAMCDLLKQYQAQAITINCLGGIYSGNMVEAYPCLGFMQLDNNGLVGACEADQRSTLTKLLMRYLTGRPGFISDPVIDTAKNQIIYAHCVASTKVYGPEGPSNPYHIRDHSEDRKGASIRSLMPLGEMTTTIQFDHNKKQVIFHQGISVENVDEDKACRTKLAVEVKGDIYKLFDYWDLWGWHRVTFYGDLKRPVYNIAALLGFEVVEEA
ncbi:MAG: hypothetical protein JW755_13480 [Candidatus Aminicenantes bacterium]|nr:hypothetical protein [Candidatus Aminicenantes bacterium]